MAPRPAVRINVDDAVEERYEYLFFSVHAGTRPMQLSAIYLATMELGAHASRCNCT